MEFFAGVIGRIHLSIPLKHLQSEPWVITLEKLHLIACPVESSEVSHSYIHCPTNVPSLLVVFQILPHVFYLGLIPSP